MKSKAIFGLFAFAVVAFGAAVLSMQSAEAQYNPQGRKVTICHRNDAVNNRYTSNSVDVDSIDGQGSNDHSHHTGPVAYSQARATELKNADIKWGDIIPPFRNDGTPTGEATLNWDAIGKAVWYAGCGTPDSASASVSVVPATCDKGAKLVYGAFTNATVKAGSTPNGTYGPGSYTVTALADKDALFFNVTPPTDQQVFAGSLAGPIGYQSNNPEAPCYVKPEVKTATAVVTTEPATCDMGEKLVWGAITNATFSGTPNGTYGPSAYSVTATATANAEFAGGSTTKQFDGDLAGPLGYQSENPEADCYVAPEGEADITATAACATVDGKMVIAVTIKNSGDADGTVYVENGDNTDSVDVKAGETVVAYYPAGTNVTAWVWTGDEEKTVLLDATLACKPGQGGNETPSTPETPKTPVVLPYTAGSMTQVLTLGALSAAGIILLAGASIKSRFLS